jgi:polysaccharide biosynthesis transport protein
VPEIEPQPETTAASTVSPFELLSVLWRRKFVVLATIIVAVGAAVALSERKPKQYSSSAQLLFRDPGFAQALFGNNLFSTGQQEPQRTTQTNIDVVTSLNVASEAKNLLRTSEPVGSLLESVTVTPNNNADIATIKATRSSPREAAALANAFAEGYIVYRRQTDRATVAQAEELVNQAQQTASPAEQTKLAESLRQLGVLRSLQTGDAEIIARAQANPTPVSPKPKRDGILGLVVGILLGSALALLVDFLDRRLKSIDDFERLAPDYPVIASVPRVPADGAAARRLAGVTGESYRMLREGLRFLDPTGRANCFLITSADENEGKSTVAVNLASALAAAGRRVVLVEADMRRPTVVKALHLMRSSPGLSDMLVSDGGLEEFLEPVDSVPGLSVLPSGTMPPNSADLLSGGRMAEVLSLARAYADVVVIDTPPLLPVADTRVLLRLREVDGVILVGRAGVTRRDRLRAATRLLHQGAVRVFGMVVTDVRTSSRSDYYHYDYEEPPPERPGGGRRARRAERNGLGPDGEDRSSSERQTGRVRQTT